MTRLSLPLPLVSIIIAAYRAERWIEPTLASASAQTHAGLEIIVVDDGSPDSTRDLVRIHAARDPRVRLVSLEQNGGQSAARNHGLSASRGEFIKFCDADDLLAPDMVALQLAVLDGRRNHVAYGEWARFCQDPAEAVFRSRPGWHDGMPVDWIVETWSDTEPMYQCGQWLLPRALLDRCGGWDSSLSLIDDFEFFTRVVLASEGVRFAAGARLYYRSGLGGSVSKRRSPDAIRAGWRAASLAVQQLLAAENSPRTRRVSADILMNFVHAYYPAAPEVMNAALRQIDVLGGSPVRPAGGRAFRLLSRVLGWRMALRLKRSRQFARPTWPATPSIDPT